MTETTQPSKRKIILISKAFQGRFIASVLATIILFGICSAILLYWLIGNDLQVQSQAAHINIANTWERLGLSILIGNVIATIIAGGTAIIVVLYISHKIAGPLYRFETLCKQVGDGHLDTITHLRANDQLQELAKSFSSMVDKLQSKRQQKNHLTDEANNELEVIKKKSDLTPEQRDSITKIESIVAKIKKI